MQASQETRRRVDIRDAVRDFQQWRVTRPRGARIPVNLWQSAVSLAAVHGVSKAATALGLDYYALKQRLNARSGDARARAKASGGERATPFVEVPLAIATTTVTCAIEVERRGGDAAHSSKLRLELEDVALTDLDALLRSVWSQRL